MKKLVAYSVLPWLFAFISYKTMAQDDNYKKDDKKETQEIIIRKKGDKDVNINVQISGDKVTINGKPLVEFKDDEITINKRKMIIRDADNIFSGDDRKLDELRKLDGMSWSNDSKEETGAFLGVTTEKNEKGARISELTAESAAAKAGLKEDDVITKLDDVKIDGPESLYKAVIAKKPHEVVKIFYLRDGKEKSVKATLQERKTSRKVFSFTSPDGSSKTLTMPSQDELRSYSDMALQSLKAAGNYNSDAYNYSFPRQKKLGLKIQDTEDGNGVKVLEVADSSASATAGIKKDDIIIEIGGVKVTNTDEVRDELQDNSDKSSYNMKVRRNGTEKSFEIKIPKKLKTANL